MYHYHKFIFTYYYDEDAKILEFLPSPLWNYYPKINQMSLNFYFNNLQTFENKTSSGLPLTLKYTRVSRYSYKSENSNIPFHSFASSESPLPFDDFYYFKKSSFISFFINNMIDVPICFKKSPSLKRRSFELPVLKFINYLMRDGRKDQTTRFFFSSISDLFTKFKIEKFTSDLLIKNWLPLYFLINSSFYGNALDYEYPGKNILDFTNENLSIQILFNNILSNDNKSIDSSFYLKNYIISKLGQISPIFSYFIYSVDKNIKKYSRGKSGKYVFIWKYIAPYKRLNLAMKWVSKEIKFTASKKLKDRIVSVITNLIVTPQNSFAWKSKTFSHNYVFRNLRKTLMSTLKTSSIA